MRILGIDPGLRATGYGLVDYDRGRCALVEGGLIETRSASDLADRLAAIYRGVEQVTRQFDPVVAVVERLFAQYRHPQTAILMGHARGVVLLALAHRGLSVVSYPASMVKRALVGHGRATKSQVAGMVAQLLGVSMADVADDVSDALALAICHSTPWAQTMAATDRAPDADLAALVHERGRRS
jgi:crossover junction endodeoxyribonuclease RuvC